MRVDHVIYATADLDAAAARFEAELGLAAAGGGRHEGLGTHNRIVPLGDGYLELLGVADSAEAARSPLGSALQRRLAGVGDGWLGWAAAVHDVGPVASRLGLTVTTIAREGLSARLAGLSEAMRAPFLPFFIARDPGVPDPGEAAGGPGIGQIELAGDEPRLREWLDGASLPVRVVKAQPEGVLAVQIGQRRLPY